MVLLGPPGAGKGTQATKIAARLGIADGSHLIDIDAYKTATAAIRTAVRDKLVVQITSEAVGKYTPAEQRGVVRGVKPEAVSMAFRELVPDASEEGAFSELLGWMKQEVVAPRSSSMTPTTRCVSPTSASAAWCRSTGYRCCSCSDATLPVRNPARVRFAAVHRRGNASFRALERLRLRPAGSRLRDDRRIAGRRCSGWL
jgi:hypothetical protein